MLKRYVQIRQFLSCLNSDEIDALTLTSSENRRVESLILQLQPFESVTQALQDESLTVSDAQALFDAVIEKYPDTAERLTSSAEIVHCPNFESALVKIQRGNISALSREEKFCVYDLLIHECRDTQYLYEGMSFAQRALKRQKLNHGCKAGQYTDTRFCVPSSNVCERLFSKAGYALSDRRKSITPANLESQIFLHFNRDLWGAADVNLLTVEQCRCTLELWIIRNNLSLISKQVELSICFDARRRIVMDILLAGSGFPTI